MAMGFPGGSVVKNLPSMQEMWVRSLGREDLLEKEMAVHSSILPMDRGAWCYSPWGCKRVRHDWATKEQQQKWQYTHMLSDSSLTASEIKINETPFLWGKNS